jgi:hypothetical protein
MAVVSIKNKLRRGNLLVGNTAYDPAGFESIATVTVGSGGASTVSFSSIPSTYTHLQLRISALTNGPAGTSAGMRFNSDTCTNYTLHQIWGDGSTVSAAGGTYSYAYIIASTFGSATAAGAAIIDILDYANTNKYKTTRILSGIDKNGSGQAALNSNGWLNTSAISSITIATDPTSYVFNQYSIFALYGIKGA